MIDGAETVFEARGLRKRFGDRTALHPLDLSVVRGEIFCLLGANGAGKSTTINLFLGFLKPDGGQALVCGIDMASDARAGLARLAYIPEQVALYPELSGIENLKHFDRLAGHRHGEDALLDLLDSTGLDRADAHRRAGEYSKGMRQKVGIAMALAKDADGLLLDEPLSGLDPSAANIFSELLTRLRERGKAVLMATHDIFRAKEIGTRVGIMRAGAMVECLELDRVDAPELERLYLSHMSAAA